MNLCRWKNHTIFLCKHAPIPLVRVQGYAGVWTSNTLPLPFIPLTQKHRGIPLPLSCLAMHAALPVSVRLTGAGLISSLKIRGVFFLRWEKYWCIHDGHPWRSFLIVASPTGIGGGCRGLGCWTWYQCQSWSTLILSTREGCGWVNYIFYCLLAHHQHLCKTCQYLKHHTKEGDELQWQP